MFESFKIVLIFSKTLTFTTTTTSGNFVSYQGMWTKGSLKSSNLAKKSKRIRILMLYDVVSKHYNDDDE